MDRRYCPKPWSKVTWKLCSYYWALGDATCIYVCQNAWRNRSESCSLGPNLSHSLKLVSSQSSEVTLCPLVFQISGERLPNRGLELPEQIHGADWRFRERWGEIFSCHSVLVVSNSALFVAVAGWEHSCLESHQKWQKLGFYDDLFEGSQLQSTPQQKQGLSMLILCHSVSKCSSMVYHLPLLSYQDGQTALELALTLNRMDIVKLISKVWLHLLLAYISLFDLPYLSTYKYSYNHWTSVYWASYLALSRMTDRSLGPN